MTIVRNWIWILLVISIGRAAQGGADKTHSGFSLKPSENKINFTIPGYELKEATHEGVEYFKPEIEESGSKAEAGQPDLPTVSTYYMVEPGKTFKVQYSIEDYETIEDIEILPFNSWDNNQDNNIEKGQAYNHNASFPQEIVSVSDPIVFRDITMVQVSLTPFQYNPVSKSLKVIKNIDMEIIESEDIETPFVPQKVSRAFEAMYKSLVVNYPSRVRNDDEYQRPAILYVLPNNIGNLFGTIEQLMDWKKRIGYDVQYVSSSAIVNNRNNLKNYIEDAYENWDNPPVFVTIVGDANSGNYTIPTWFENYSWYNGEGDMPYTTLEGGDVYPEVFIGRLSFSTSAHLSTIVSKTLNYESNPYMNDNWFQRACLVGDPSTSGISCIITNENIHEMLELANFHSVNTVYSGSFPNQMVSGMNQGVSFFNYRGFYGVSEFNSGDVNSTTNGFMLPVATVITCGTGSFASEDESIMEAFHRAGTSSNPKGAVACIGTATLGTHTMFNNMVDMGFYYATLIEGMETAGAALMYGKMMLYKNYPSNPNSYCDIFTHWNNLMGESSLQMWTSMPEITTVDHPFALAKGTNYIDISVNKNTGPVEDAWVTILMEDEIFETGYTNSEGFIRLPVRSQQTGEVLVTVTKKNHYPYKNSFNIYTPDVSLGFDAQLPYSLDDDQSGNSSGNSDMIANGGETIEIFVAAKNYGSQLSSGVTGVISSTSEFLSIIPSGSIVSFGDIEPGAAITSDEPFIITLDDGLSDHTDLELIVTFSDEQSNSFGSVLDIDVAGNSIRASDVDVLGNASDILYPGQSSFIKIQLENLGSTSASSISGTITSVSPFLNIIDNSGTWSSVAPGSESYNNNDYFEIRTLDETIPGTVAHLILNIETEQGYRANSILDVQIGEPTVNDPVGPDSYGYYIYDNMDINYLIAPTYDWVEIDSRLGGPGTHLNSLTDNGDNQDDVEHVNLPFSFQFYGVEYTQISISSNGWIAMGKTELESFRNYQLPGVGGPSKMVAVFWDDLTLTGGGRVYTWYDQMEKKFYIEWSDVETYQNGSDETFQAVLLDPSYYTTPTGDGEILIQYKEFNNTSYGSYDWDQIHGDYCTVGIEDHTMTKGLQYTFNNTYHPAAMQLADERSILITTRGSDLRMEGDLNYDQIVDVYDLMLMVDYNLGHEGQVNPYFGDINGDGMVNVMDLIALISMIMGYGL